MKKTIILAILALAQTVLAQTGNIFVDENHNGKRIYNIATPTLGTDVTNKTYVDDLIGGAGTVTSVDSSTDISWLTATGGPITTTGTLQLNGNFPGDGSLFLDGTGNFVAIPGSGSGVSQLISGGGVAWTGTGFNYIISAATYMINGVQYSSAQTPVTLSAADPTQDRIDVFYVDDSGTAGVIEGDPGTPPIAPSVDPGSQLDLTFAYIVADTTEPVVTNVNIYLENTEYTMSTNAGTINLASTNNPYAGTKDIEGTATVSGNQVTALKPSGTLDLSGYTQLTFQIRSKASWPNAKSISIFWMNGTTVVGSSVALKNGTFGFDSSNTATYQQIVIPAANFGTGTNAVDRLRMTVSGGGGSIGWYIDNIILQAGGGGGGGGGTVTNFTSGNLSPLFTTSVTNPTTTPNLAFTLSTAGANTHYANATGSTAVPSFTADAALTKTDDTNVTLTLGGSASTALLHAASLTLGWSGQLAVSRGGTGAATFPAHNYFGNNTGSTAAPAPHQIDYSELTGTPAPITPAELSKGDDTNVTLTLTGTPTTALLQATTITAGWLGQLALTRGGTAANLSDPGADRLWGWDDTDNAIGFWTIGTGLTYTHASHTLSATAQAQTHAVTFVMDGYGSVLTARTGSYIKIPYGGTLTGWTLIGSPSGSITIDIVRAADTAGLPVTSIIGAGTKPALASAVENKSTSFTSWTSTTLTAFDNLAIVTSGITSTTYVCLILYYQ